MGWLIIFAVISTIPTLCFIPKIDCSEKNLGKKRIELRGIFKRVIIRSKLRLSITKPYDSYDYAKDMYVEDIDFKHSVSRVGLLLQLLSYIFLLASVTLLILDIDVTGVSAIAGWLGAILSAVCFKFAMIVCTIFFIKGFKVANKFENYYKERSSILRCN